MLHSDEETWWASPTMPSIFTEVSMIRAACKVYSGHEVVHSKLIENAREFSCLALAVSTMIPPGWGSLALCTNLLLASI